MKWEIVDSKIGYPTIKVVVEDYTFWIHSRYDPIKEAKNLVGNIEILPNTNKIVVVGMGAGYHVRELLLNYPNTKIEVWDFNENYGQWVKQSCPIVQEILTHPNIVYKYTENITDIEFVFYKEVTDPLNLLFIHKPSLEIINPDLFEVKLFLRQVRLLEMSFTDQKSKMLDNFYANVSLNCEGINKFINSYKNKPFILVSAGPSLTKQLPLLKIVSSENKAIIGCVGTALTPLLINNIVPNFVMISDPNQEILQQFIYAKNLSIPLFFLSTADHQTVRSYKGPKYIVWQKGYTLAEKQALLRKEPLISTGGSVATCLLDLIVKMGAASVALIGQDLSFSNNQTHADFTAANRQILDSKSLLEVENYYRDGTVKTSLNLYTYKKWFENYAANMKKDIELWNCTEGGAYIKGWKHDTLFNYLAFIDKF